LAAAAEQAGRRKPYVFVASMQQFRSLLGGKADMARVGGFGRK